MAKSIKCTVCTTRCPLAEANPDYPGPKQAGPDGERLRIKNPQLYDEALKYCTNCKRCEVACPSGVQVGTINLHVAYHSPCHLIKQGGYTMELLNSIPGLEVIMLDQKCCGMSGTYGFKKENYETSQKIGQAVFDQLSGMAVDYVVTDCESCKMQIEMNTSFKVLHPLTLMAQSLV